MTQTRWDLPRIAHRLFNQPHAITPGKLEAIVWALRDRLGGDLGEPSAEALAIGQSGSGDSYAVRDGVAVIPVHGTLVQRGTTLDAESGLVGYDYLVSLAETAEADDNVDAILLDIDSGGGEVAGAMDAADRISEIASRFPMAALANETACSAAYLVASATGRVWVTQSAAVGSIGVIMAHVDQTGANEQRGLEITELFAGGRKADGWPNHQLGDEERGRLQSFINASYDMLVAKVAGFRGMDEQAIRDTEAGIFLASARFSQGLADNTHTIGSAVEALRPQRSSNTRNSRMAKAKQNQLHAGENLANTLNDLIQQQVTDERSSQDVQDDMAEAAGIDPSTVDSILNAEINCPPLERLEGFAEVLDTSTETLREAAEQDGCEYSSDGAAAACGVSKPGDPADIADLCAKAGVPDEAASLIREQATLDRARERVSAIGTMRERCEAAVSAGMVSRQRADDLLESAMTAKKGPDQLSTDLLNAAVKDQTPDDAVQSRITPDAHSDESSRGWNAAAEQVAKQFS